MTDRPVGAEICNAIVTEAPLSDGELVALRDHFRGLTDILAVSGPRFSQARRDAIDLHNKVVRRMVGIRDERKRRETLEADEGLLEIRA